MSKVLSPERELLSAQIRGAWKRTASSDATPEEHHHLVHLLARLAPGQNHTLVDAAATRFAGEIHDPSNPMRAEIAKCMLLMFFAGMLDLASISEEGEFVWTATDAGLEADL